MVILLVQQAPLYGMLSFHGIKILVFVIAHNDSKMEKKMGRMASESQCN